DIHEGCLAEVIRTVRAASALAAQDVNFYKSVDADLAQKIDTSANCLGREQIDTECGSSIRFGIDNISSESDWKPVANILDSIFENIDNGNDVNSKHSGKRDNRNLNSSFRVPPNYENSIEIVDPAFYPQPYEYEIDTQPYPASILEKSEPIAPQDWTSTTATWVDTVEELQKMVEELKKSSEIAE
ncbi:hypothetical protein G9P44_005446, partial [Scheffersomyces stipitis]